MTNFTSVVLGVLKRSIKSSYAVTFVQYRSISHTIKDILNTNAIDTPKLVTAKGWINAFQHHKNVTFLKLSDGSTLSTLQVVVPQELNNVDLTFGSSVSVEGKLVESKGQGQQFELITEKITLCGKCDAEEFPLKHRINPTTDFIRDIPHLRPRTNSFKSLLRLRNAASNAIHKYFQDNQFLFIHTPIITTNDCEGGGEVFTVEPYNKDVIEDLSEEEDANTPRTYFRKPVYLTVSGQLHLEIITGSVSRCYNFGPTFRADHSRDRTHLSEFYMVEAEVAFTHSLEDILEIIEGLVKFTFKELENKCGDDLEFQYKYVADKDYKKVVQPSLDNKFTRMTYTDAVKILEKKNKKFNEKIKWGDDFKKEHERYIVQYNNNIPVFVTDFPACIKPFYARANDDGKTVSSVDLHVPEVGELVGGTMREERYDILKERLQRDGLTESLNCQILAHSMKCKPRLKYGEDGQVV